MSRTLNSTQASAACSRGLTRSHNPPIPPPTTSYTSYTSATSPISSTLSTPSTPNRRPSRPTTPVRRPHPFRGRPYDEVAAGDTSDSSLMGYIPSPIDAPDFSPIRSPYSPCGSFPSTPSSAIPTRYFVSPVNDREGARERRRESRPSPLTSLLASRGIQRELTPSPQALCPECTKVKMLLPARWCGHQVTPSRMRDGWRIVRINPNLGKTMGSKAQKRRVSRRTTVDKAKPIFTDSSDSQVEEHMSAVNESEVESSFSGRVSASPVAESTPTPEPSAVSTPSYLRAPFKNPDLNDQPLHWSPRMFKPQIDRHNWTWSEWDSPSQTIEECTYETTDWPIHDPFSRYPPHVRQQLRAVLAMQPEKSQTMLSAEDFSSVKLDLGKLEIGIGQSDPFVDKDDAKSSDEGFSSWVMINDRPWTPELYQMWIDSEKDRERQAARRRQFQPSDDTSSVSSLDTMDLLAELHDPDNHYDSRDPEPRFPEPSYAKPSYPESDHSAHPASYHSESSRSGSINLSYLLQRHIESFGDPPSSPGETLPSITDTDGSFPEVIVPSVPLPDVPAAPALAQDEPILPESTSKAPASISEPTSEEDTFSPIPISSLFPEAPTAVAESTIEDTFSPVPIPSLFPEAPTAVAESTREDTFSPVPLPALTAEAPALPQAEEEEFSSWIDVDTRKWTDLTFRFHTRQEEGRRMGMYDNGSNDSNSDSSNDSDFSFDITGHLEKNYGISLVSQQHFQFLRESQQPSIEARPAATSSGFAAARQLPSVTVMEPIRLSRDSSRGSEFGWKSLACVAVTAAAVGAGLAYAWFST
ncbi:hypothetical protein F4806DRAFT_495289 [Annulohypoxylon nitens]|nr:hypothetical protein F4806DRAFT_495289 [Annulohypoxylon nitens]